MIEKSRQKFVEKWEKSSPIIKNGLTLFTSSGVFLLFFSPQLVIFKCLPHPQRGGIDSLFLLFFLFSFDSPMFLLFFLFLFVFLFHRICMSYLSYPAWWHGITLLTAVLTAYVRGNVYTVGSTSVVVVVVVLTLTQGLGLGCS